LYFVGIGISQMVNPTDPYVRSGTGQVHQPLPMRHMTTTDDPFGVALTWLALVRITNSGGMGVIVIDSMIMVHDAEAPRPSVLLVTGSGRKNITAAGSRSATADPLVELSVARCQVLLATG
jgi:hypothetical protein